jgi:hypothetical protein
MRKSYLPLLAVLVLVAAACSSDASEQIEGTWLEAPNWVYLEIGDDGQFKVAENSDVEGPFEWGDYTFDGETFTMNTASDAVYCPDTSITSTVVFSADGDQADLTFVEDSCVGSPRSADLVWIRQSS